MAAPPETKPSDPPSAEPGAGRVVTEAVTSKPAPTFPRAFSNTVPEPARKSRGGLAAAIVLAGIALVATAAGGWFFLGPGHRNAASQVNVEPAAGLGSSAGDTKSPAALGTTGASGGVVSVLSPGASMSAALPPIGSTTDTSSGAAEAAASSRKSQTRPQSGKSAAPPASLDIGY